MRPFILSVLSVYAIGCGGQIGNNGEGSVSQKESTACFPVGGVSGIDVSDAQGNVDWSAAAGAGISFAFMKATQGAHFTASTFAANWAAAPAAGVMRGAYHFFDPTQDGVAQANYFLGVMGALGPGDLPPVLDLECPNGDPQCLGYPGGSGQAPAALVVQRASDWLEAVAAATGRTPIIYSGAYYFNGLGADLSPLKAYPLWLLDLSGNCVPAPPGFPQAPLFQQYNVHGRAGGVRGEVDLDRFAGSLDDLRALAGAAAPPPQPNPQPQPDPQPQPQSASCASLGYYGQCVGSVAEWQDNGSCLVRDCAAEGLACGLISSTVGFGCVGGAPGQNAIACGGVGYAGTCTAGGVLVWAENGACKVVDCATLGKSCGYRDGTNGFDCL